MAFEMRCKITNLKDKLPLLGTKQSFTPTSAARKRCTNHSACEPFSVYTLLATPYAQECSIATASSQELAQ
jgi:hypothetical protein